MKITTITARTTSTSLRAVMPAFASVESGAVCTSPVRRRCVEAAVSYAAGLADAAVPAPNGATGALGVRAWRPPVT